MVKQNNNSLVDYIEPLNINGLQGRMLRLPATANKKREILLLYGHHASIERMFGVAEDLNKYGAVTLPDFPGFGGMQSFYTIGKKPSIDNLADYLASFIKLRYKRKRITIIGMSLAFVIVTRMLQKYPDIAKKIDLLVSMVGFVHKNDFRFNKLSYYSLRFGCSLFSRRLPAAFMKHLILRRPLIRMTYEFVSDTHAKLIDADKEERDRRIDFEIILWQTNDVRTYMDTTVSMMKLDLCNQRVKLPIVHVAVNPDRYFDNNVVEQHLNVIYEKVDVCISKIPGGHAPTVVATAKEAEHFLPSKIKRLLSKAP